ncbi:hypothetical protein D3C72_2363550 [compost metagenome]
MFLTARQTLGILWHYSIVQVRLKLLRILASLFRCPAENFGHIIHNRSLPLLDPIDMEKEGSCAADEEVRRFGDHFLLQRIPKRG